MDKKATLRTQQGQGLVEFALTATLLLVLFMGIVDLGRALFTFMALRDAAQEGAAYGSVYPDDTAGIETRARDSSSNPVDLSDTALVDVDIVYIGPPCSGSGIEVTVSYPDFELLTPLLGTILGGETIPIRAHVTDTILTPGCP